MTHIITRENWQNTLNHSSTNTISVSSFNTLRKYYGFRGKYWVDENVKEWETRLSMHKQLLPELNVDVLCLQEAEVSCFDDFADFMQEHGYSAVRPTTKDKNSENHGHTKPSIFYKSSRLQLIWQNTRSRTVLALFEELHSKKQFYVINCHLQGGKGQEHQRCFQIRSALQQLQIHVKSQKIPEDELICFLCGDMNATSEEPVHQWISEGALTTENLNKFFAQGGFNFTHGYKFEDSCASVTDADLYTFKWGVNEDADFMRIDYIYCTPKTVDVVYIRDPLTAQQRIEMSDQCGIPNPWHPSDHLPVATLFQFK